MNEKRLKNMIREVVREELKTALMREITVEKGPRVQGDPEKRVETVNVSILDFMATYLPRIEGALRGVQADTDRAKNNSAKAVEGLERVGKTMTIVGQTLIGMEGAAKRLASFSERVRLISPQSSVLSPEASKGGADAG